MASSGKYRGYRTPVNYLSKSLTKLMDLTKYPELQTVRGIEDVPKELRTPVYRMSGTRYFGQGLLR